MIYAQLKILFKKREMYWYYMQFVSYRLIKTLTGYRCHAWRSVLGAPITGGLNFKWLSHK